MPKWRVRDADDLRRLFGRRTPRWGERGLFKGWWEILTERIDGGYGGVTGLGEKICVGR